MKDYHLIFYKIFLKLFTLCFGFLRKRSMIENGFLYEYARKYHDMST